MIMIIQTKQTNKQANKQTNKQTNIQTNSVRVLHFCFQHRVTKNDPTSILAVTGS
jgi:hypothetical protein